MFNGTTKAVKKDSERLADTLYLIFTDTFTNIQLLNPSGGGDQGQAYAFSERGIAWGGESDHYTNNPPGVPSDYLPPPNWAERYPDGYTEFPQLADDEHFQVWMRTAALPTFSKLWGRNDNDAMASGTYEMTINMSKSMFRLREIYVLS